MRLTIGWTDVWHNNAFGGPFYHTGIGIDPIEIFQFPTTSEENLRMVTLVFLWMFGSISTL
jgi:hypothetical protein